MNTFQHEENENISYISLSEIGLSTPILNTIKMFDQEEPNNYIMDYSAPQFGRLNRLELFKNFNEDIYPPVTLKYIPEEKMYTIIDGRHRVAMSIVNRMSHIPAIIKY